MKLLIVAMIAGTLVGCKCGLDAEASTFQLDRVKAELTDTCPELKQVVATSALDGFTQREYKIFREKCSKVENGRKLKELVYGE